MATGPISEILLHLDKYMYLVHLFIHLRIREMSLKEHKHKWKFHFKHIPQNSKRIFHLLTTASINII